MSANFYLMSPSIIHIDGGTYSVVVVVVVVGYGRFPWEKIQDGA